MRAAICHTAIASASTNASGSSGRVFALNDDTEMLEPGAIGSMLAHAQEPQIGVVGALLPTQAGASACRRRG